MRQFAIVYRKHSKKGGFNEKATKIIDTLRSPNQRLYAPPFPLDLSQS
jgi:hypothetical protein